jgi:16S rRNA (guanine(966)-N(2))-methyltransferase RsmD
MESKLQIISGKWRGRKLHLPRNARPTQNKARIALFNILSGFAPNIVWDAFAGSGAFGIEWLSRGANKVIFTDIDTDSIKTIKKNLGTDKGAIISQTDALSAVEKYGADADIIFIDPPYADSALGAEFIRKLAPVAKPGAIMIWEMEKNSCEGRNPLLPSNLKIIKDKTYGRARFLVVISQ